MIEKRVIGFTVDGLVTPYPYNDLERGIKVYQTVRDLILEADFGVKIKWNGRHRVEVKLCDAYNEYVCGLCGNSDGNN